MKMRNWKFTFLLLCPLALLLIASFFTVKVSAATVWLDDLDVSLATQGWGDPKKNQSIDGHNLSIGGQAFARGFGTHAESVLYINLKIPPKRFLPALAWMTRFPNPPRALNFS